MVHIVDDNTTSVNFWGIQLTFMRCAGVTEDPFLNGIRVGFCPRLPAARKA